MAGTARSVIDYSLARRATLTGLFSGRASATEVCDAHPDLLRAAKHHGEPVASRCPVCRRERLSHVTWVYGDELGEASGRARASHEIARLEITHAELGVYVVEVCRGCGWNHLVASFVVGTGGAQTPRRARRRTAEK